MMSGLRKQVRNTEAAQVDGYHVGTNVVWP